MAKEGGSFDFSEQIGDINFTIDDTSKCYTIPNYDYWLSSTLINSYYGLDIEKLKKVINEGKYNKLGVHGLTINWDNAQITVNDEDTSINTTPDLFKAIQDAGTTVGLNSNGKLRNSEFTNKYYDLSNKINKLQDELNIEYSEPEIEDALVQFDGFDWFNGTNNMSVIVGTEITLPTSASKNDTDQFSFTFDGWENNSTNETYTPGESVIIRGDTTFIARFITIPRKYLVTFKVNNGYIISGDGISASTLNEAQTYVSYGQQTKWTIEPNEADGYGLPTYVTNGTINGNEVTCDPVYEAFICIADCILEDTSYTYIGEQEYMVDYAYYDGNDREGEWESAKVGSTIKLLYTLPRLQILYDNEVDFYGWRCSTDENLYPGGTNYTFSSNDINGYGYNSDSVGTVEFTAEYKIHEYTLSFDVQGGSKSVSDIKQEYNTTITLPSYDGTKDNYSFNGWLIDDIRYSPGENYTITKNVTAYAEWTYIGDEPEEPEIEDALVQFDGFESFSGESRSMTVSVGTEITLPTSATKSTINNGNTQHVYLFVYWKDNSTNTLYHPEDKVTINGDTTFTAIFLEVTKFLVTFKVNNGKILSGEGISSQNEAYKYMANGVRTSWTIEPDEGYSLPTSVTNGTINGNLVTCNIVNESSFECIANCIEEDISYTYIGYIGE